MFKDVTIKEKLHSPKFIENTDDKFDFKIDDISHVSRFRRKKDKFMEALELPKKATQRY